MARRKNRTLLPQLVRLLQSDQIRYHPELKTISELGHPDLIERINDLYYNNAFERPDPRGRPLQQLKNELDALTREEEFSPKDRTASPGWKGLKTKRELSTGKLIGIIIRGRGKQKRYWLVDLNTGTTLDGPFTTLSKALEAQRELLEGYDLLDDDE